MDYWFIHDRKEYTAIKSRKSGMVTDLNVQKLKEIALSNNDATEFGVDKPCYYLQVNSLHHDVKKGRILLWVHNDLLANKKQKETIEKLAHEAFFIKPQSLNWESLQNSVGRLKELSLDLLAKGKQQEFKETLIYYGQLIETFYDYAKPYSEDVRSQLNPSSIWWGEPNPVHWITDDIQEIFESGIDAKRSFAIMASSLPFLLMRHAINCKDFSIFEKLRYYPYLLYKHSYEAKKAGNAEKAKLLFEQSWRRLKRSVDIDLYGKAKDKEYPIEWIERFACAILAVFQDLLKASFDKRDFDSFEKYLSVTTKLFKNLENTMRSDNIDRVRGLVDSLKQKNQEVIFGLSSWILGKWRENRGVGDIERFYSAIQKETPSEIERLTNLFSRCHSFETIDFHGWNHWETEGQEEGEVHFVDSFAKLEVFYAVRALSLLANKASKEIEEINLPHSRTLEALARGLRRLMPTLDSIKENPSEWKFALTDASIEKIDSFKNLLIKAKEAQEQEDAETIRKRTISTDLVNECKEKTKKTFSESAIMRDIFTKCFKSYDDQAERDIAESDGWLGIRQLIGKDIFLDDWHVDGSLVREDFGRPMAQGENDILFKEIANKLPRNRL